MLTKECWQKFWEDYPEPYISDGIDINHLDDYLKQPVKVLFILKESNESCNISTDNQILSGHKSIFDDDGWFGKYDKNNRSDGAIITKMIKMYSYITEKDYNVASKYCVYNFGFMNVNKSGDGTDTTDDNELKAKYNSVKVKLKEEIELLNPDIIVSGVKAIDLQEIANENAVFVQTRHFGQGFSYKHFEEAYKSASKNR